jgi:hypothetical protein
VSGLSYIGCSCYSFTFMHDFSLKHISWSSWWTIGTSYLCWYHFVNLSYLVDVWIHIFSVSLMLYWCVILLTDPCYVFHYDYDVFFGLLFFVNIIRYNPISINLVSIHRSAHCGGTTSRTPRVSFLWLIAMIETEWLRQGMSCTGCWMR